MQVGSIWRAMFGNTPRLLVVVALHFEHASILVLSEESKGPKSVRFSTLQDVEYWATPDMISYKFYCDFDTLEGQLVPESIDLLLKKTAECLGLHPNASVNADELTECWDKVDRLKAQNDGLQDRNNALEAELVKLKTECHPADDAQREIDRLTAQRDLYREEYRELLASLIGK